MPRRVRRNAFTSKIRKRMARLYDCESHLDQINEFYMRPNCAANKATTAFYFYWLNKIRTPGQKISRNSPHSNIIFFIRPTIIEANNCRPGE